MRFVRGFPRKASIFVLGLSLVGCVADETKVTIDGGSVCATQPDTPGCRTPSFDSGPPVVITDAATPDVSVPVDAADAAPLPTLLIISPAPFAVVCSSFQVSVQVPPNAPALTYACDLDGAALACAPPNIALSGLAGGSHTLVVRATAPDGTIASAQLTFVVDEAKPVVTITSPGANEVTCPAGNITYSVTDVASTSSAVDLLECKIENVVGGVVTSSVACGGTPSAPTYTGLASSLTGSHRITVRVKDACGNSGEATRSFNVDSLPPKVSVTAPANATQVCGSGPIAFTATDDAPSVSGALTFSSATVDASPCTASGTLCRTDQSGTEGLGHLGLGAGSHTARVVVADACGNVNDPSSAGAGRGVSTFTVDATGPVITAVATAGAVNSGGATVALASGEALSGATGAVALTVPSAPSSLAGSCSCTSSACSCTGLAAGHNRLAVSGVDLCGNVGPTVVATTNVAFGPYAGHAVLIGHDYTDANTPPRLVGNTAALTPFVHDALSIGRNTVRVLAWRPAGVATVVTTRVKSALQTALVQYGISFDATDPAQYLEFSDGAQLANLLAGRDVLLAYEAQGSVADNALDALGNAWAPTLAAFGDAGGVIVGLDSGSTYRLFRRSNGRPLIDVTGLTDAASGSGPGGFLEVASAYPAAALGTSDFFITAGVPAAYPLPSGSTCFDVADGQASFVYERHSANCSDGCTYSYCPIVVDRALPAFDLTVSVAPDANATLPACVPPVTGANASGAFAMSGASGPLPTGAFECFHGPAGFSADPRTTFECTVTSSAPGTLQTSADSGTDGLHRVSVAVMRGSEPLRVGRSTYVRDTIIFASVFTPASDACGLSFIVNEYAPNTADAACGGQLGGFVPFKTVTCSLEHDSGGGVWVPVATRTGTGCGAVDDPAGGFTSGTLPVDWSSDIATNGLSGNLRSTVTAEDFHGNVDTASADWTLAASTSCGGG